MGDLIPTSLSAIAWTAVSVGAGAVAGLLVDKAMRSVLPIRISQNLPYVLSMITGENLATIAKELFLNEPLTTSAFPQSDLFIIIDSVSSPVPLAVRALAQITLGVFAVGEMTTFFTNLSPGSVVPIGDGALMFWFFICQPSLLLNVALVMGQLYQYFHKNIGIPITPETPGKFETAPDKPVTPPAAATTSVSAKQDPVPPKAKIVRNASRLPCDFK